MGRRSDGGQTLAAHAAAVAQSRAAALGALASEKTMLPFAAHFGRLILSFHISNHFTILQLLPSQHLGKSPGIGTRENNSELLSVNTVVRGYLSVVSSPWSIARGETMLTASYRLRTTDYGLVRDFAGLPVSNRNGIAREPAISRTRG